MTLLQSSEIFYLTLEERVKLNRLVYERAKELERASGRAFTVVSSGHVSDSIEDQIKELNAIYESGTDALILITNRLDPKNEGDEVFLANLESIIEKLPRDAKLGLYECPHPYKRLVTPRILEYCVKTGRFYYMKDTCCDAELILLISVHILHRPGEILIFSEFYLHQSKKLAVLRNQIDLTVAAPVTPCHNTEAF